MKKFYLLVFTIFCTICLYAQSFSWAKTGYRPNCSNGVYPKDIAVDGSNNVYSVGAYYSLSTAGDQASWDGNSLYGFTSGSFENNIFVVKYNSLGVVQYLKRIGTDRSMEGIYARVTTDQADNLIITNKLSGTSGGSTAYIDGYTVPTTVYPNDALITKLNSAGVRQWHQHISGSSGKAQIFDVETDASNNIYVCGNFGGTITFDGNTYVGTAGFDYNVFVAKLDPNGNLLWFRQSTTATSGIHYANNIAISGSDVYIYGGAFRNAAGTTLTIGGQSITYPNQLYRGDFLIKYNTTGTIQWLRGGYAADAGGAGVALVNRTGLDVDAAGNVYTVQGTDVSAGGMIYRYLGSALTQNLTDGGNYVMSKYNSSGTLLWVNGDGGASGNGSAPTSLTYHSSGKLFMTNLLTGTSNIDGNSYTAIGSADALISEFDLNGNVVNTNQYGESGAQNWPYNMVEMPNGSLAFAGHCWNAVGGVPSTVSTYDGINLTGCRNTGIAGVFNFCVAETNTTSTATICESSTKALTSSGAGGGTWSIVSGGGSIAGTTYTPANIAVNTSVTIRYTDACGTPTDRVFTVTPILSQPSTITGATPICSSSQTYSVTNVAGVTYAWSYSGGGTPSSTTNSVTFTPTSSGTLSVTATNTCGTSTARTLAITVDAGVPAQPSVITGNTNICSSSQTYSVTNVAGVTYAWSYTGGGTPSSTTNSVTFTPTSSGTLSVTASNACGTSAARTLAITVAGASAPAQPSAITGATPICTSSQTYSVTNVASVTYAWSYTGGGTPSSTTNSVTFTPTSSGTLSVTASNACGPSTPRTLAITVDAGVPAQPSTITGATPVCSSSQTYSVTNVAGVTYVWSYSGGGTATSTTNSVTFTPTSSGTLSVTASNACGTSAARTLAITVDAGAPAQPSAITGVTPVCSSSQTYSVTNVAGVTYAWSYSGGGTATSTTNSVTFTPTSSGTLSVTATNACGTSAARTLAITVDAGAPAQPSTITGATPVCSSSQTYSVTNVAGVTYAWSYSGGGTATSTTNSVTFTPTSSGTLSVTATNACGTSAARTLAITVDAGFPAQPSAITGATPVCSTSETYSVTNVAGVTYAWSYSGGGTPTGTTNSTTFTPTSSGTLSVTATNACGTSPASNLAITVLAGVPAQPSTITGNVNVCSTSETYSVTNVAGVTYGWTYSGGGTPTGTTNSTTFTPTSSGTLSVTATNACGTSSAQTLAINVASGVPAQPSAISGPTSICSISPQTYSVTNVAGVTYGWTYSGGGTPTGTTNSTTFTPSSSGTLSVTASNACGTSAPETLNIVIGTSIPATPGAITGATTLCSSSSTYGIVPVTGAATYNWAFTGGGTPSSTTSTVTFTPTSSGILSVTATNPCGTSAASTLNITVDNGVPAQPSAITGNNIICDNSLQSYSVTNVIGVTYTWSYSGVGSPSSTTNTVSFTPTSSGTLSVIATNSCGASTPSTLNIVVDVLSPVNIGADQAICAGSTVSLSVPNNVAYTYLWSDGSTLNTFSANPVVAQTIWVRITNASGCIVNDSLNITITGPTSINANNDSATVITDRLEVLDVTTNDSQAGTLTVINTPQFGVASIDGNGNITYKSYIDYIGTDVFTYEICDAFCFLTCDTATVYIKVEHNVFDNPDNGNIGSWGVTPNGDGINDVLLIDGLFEFPENEITIYNRWGDKVYNAKPYNQDWNGVSPNEMVNGTYFFILEIEGKPEPFKGFIHLQK